MKNLVTLAAAVICSATLAACADAAVRSQASANKEQAEADYKLARENCQLMAGDAKEACVAKAKGRYEASKETAKTDAKAMVNEKRAP